MAGIELSSGVLGKILGPGFSGTALLQVLGVKKILTGSTEKYRLIVSDGKYSTNCAMLSAKINDLAHLLELNCIIKLNKHLITEVQNAGSPRRILVVLDFDLVTAGSVVGGQIGDPVLLIIDEPLQRKEMKNRPDIEPSKQLSNERNGPETFEGQHIVPIQSLNPYQMKWVIKAKVINKSGIRTWKNSRGEGKLFNVDLMDATGEIRATAFNDDADKYFDLLEEDKVYFISGCQIKMANKQFNYLKNDYEMTFGRESTVKECFDKNNIPCVNYNFVPLSQVHESDVDEIIDVIGVCVHSTDLDEFQSKNGKNLKKRVLSMADESLKQVLLTLWGDDAVNFKSDLKNPIIVVKSAKVSEFRQTKTLSTISGNMKVNPDIPEAHRLQGWFQTYGAQKIDSSFEIKNSYANKEAQIITLYEADHLKVETKAYCDVVAYVDFIRSECVYKACGSDSCFKKVVPAGSSYYCGTCEKEYERFKYCYMIKCELTDHTGSIWATCFNTNGNFLLGKTAEEFGELLENQRDDALSHIATRIYRQFMFRLQIKSGGGFDDKSGKEYMVVKCEPLDYNIVLKHTIASLKKVK